MGLLSKATKVKIETELDRASEELIVGIWDFFFTASGKDIPTIHVPPGELKSLFRRHLHHIALRDAKIIGRGLSEDKRSDREEVSEC